MCAIKPLCQLAIMSKADKRSNLSSRLAVFLLRLGVLRCGGGTLVQEKQVLQTHHLAVLLGPSAAKLVHSETAAARNLAHPKVKI